MSFFVGLPVKYQSAHNANIYTSVAVATFYEAIVIGVGQVFVDFIENRTVFHFLQTEYVCTNRIYHSGKGLSFPGWFDRITFRREKIILAVVCGYPDLQLSAQDNIIILMAWI